MMLVPTDADVVEVPVHPQLFKPQLHQLFIMEVQRTLVKDLVPMVNC